MARRVAVAALLLPFLLVLAIPAVHAQAPKRGGVIRIAEREAPGLDPHLTISFLSHSYVSLSYSQLVRFPNGPEQKSATDFSILPDLAEKWTVSKDGKIYTFFLRKGVKFHNKPPVNGREVNAEDVKYSLERFMAKSGFATRFEPVTAHRRRGQAHGRASRSRSPTRPSSITWPTRRSASSCPARPRRSSRTSIIPTP